MMIFLYVLFGFIGLALLLVGMKVMCRSLESYSKGRLEKLLLKATSNKYKSVIFGAGLTAFMQSSSAITVLLVGLANASILSLKQIVGIIMGANIGTTSTALIVSLSSANVGLPVPIMVIMSILCFIAFIVLNIIKKKEKALLFLGLTFILIGIFAMSNAFSPFKSIIMESNFLSYCTNPFIGILIGIVMTAILQSSSASVTILQALSTTGALTFSVALPIIVGQNIGSCVTALISTIGGNKNSKATAFIHLYFNVIGSFFLLTIFYGLNIFIDYHFANDVVNMMDITIIHFIFNLLSTILLLPFSSGLVYLAKKTVH